MKISREIFVLATAARPIQFLDEYGDLIENWEEAKIFYDRELAEAERQETDEPERFEVLSGAIELESV